MKRLTSIRALLLLGAVPGMIASTAYGQTKPGDNLNLEEIVVTGSRVITNGNDSPTPVTVVAAEDLKEVRPGNLAEALADMPVFSGQRGMNSNTNGGGAASPATSNAAVNVANMRQLGMLRNLVLYDGHRAPPSTPDGFVDLDTIPQLLIKRVDVVTGGVSAVYGSDAITGVINFVTDTKFEGIKANLQAGRSTYGDADTAEGGFAFGTGLFGGRGHVMGSFETRHAAPIDSKLARPWGRDVRTIQGSGTAQYPYIQLNGVRINNLTFGGRVNNNAILGDKQFASGGYLVPFVHGVGGLAAGISNTANELGGDGGYYFQQLRSGLDMNQGYLRLDYDFTDTMHGYVSAADTLNHSTAVGAQYANAALSISRDNAYLLQAYKDQLTTAGQTQFTFGKIFTGLPRNTLETYSRQLLVNAGLQGSLGDYKWDVAFTDGKGTFDVTQNAAINQGRLFAAMDSVVSNGIPVCRASLTNAAYADCVPLNPFGVNSESQAAVNYIMQRVGWETSVGMQDVAASITGAPFDTWAGPVNAALSAEWRRLTYEIDSNSPTSAARANCSGIAVNCGTATLPYVNATVDSVPEISTRISEAAVEFGVPLLKDATLAKSLDLNTAYRFAHYDRAGDANTWKFGMTWDALDSLTVRATRSRDFRAPSLDENFRAQSVSFTTFPDALLGVNNQVQLSGTRTENGGNPNLRPEIGDTLTYGVVVRPTSNFDIAVDAFDIKIRDAIFSIQGNNTTIQRACYDSGGSSPYCSLIVRQNGGPATGTPATNPVAIWKQTFINLAEIDSWGADIEAGFRTTLASRPLSLRVLATYQPHLIYKQPGVPTVDYAGANAGSNGIQATPRWRATAFINFKPTDNFAIAVQERWRNSLTLSPDRDVEAGKVKAVAFTNINLTYQPKMEHGNLDVFLNVQNLFNTDPPQAGFYLNQTPGMFGEFSQGDDIIGRYYTVGVRYRM
jgi:outer membrane receptor protein involved in Fe transport